MLFITIIIFAVTGSLLVALAIAKPIPNWKAGGMAMPLTRHSSSLHSNASIDLDAISSHGVSVREKILRGLDNYEMNTGTKHPFAVERSESGFRKRGTSLPLTAFEDKSWNCKISLGTPAKIFNVHIDTGAADMWVVQTGCKGCTGIGVSAHIDSWDPRSSSSAKYDGQSFSLTYGDGSKVEGQRYTDTVTIAGFTAHPQTIGSATSYTSGEPDKGYYADGLLGLAFPSISRFRAVPLFQSLARQNKLMNPTFSLKLSSSGAEMYVGGANSQLYRGDITYTPVTKPGFWQVSMDDVRVDGHEVLKDVPVVLDTGANHIFGDFERVSELYKPLGGTLKEQGDFGFYSLPCNSFPTVSLTFGGRTFEILPEDLRLDPTQEDSSRCFSTIIAYRVPYADFWTVGMPFLQGVYSVFDYSNEKVGFANLA